MSQDLMNTDDTLLYKDKNTPVSVSETAALRRFRPPAVVGCVLTDLSVQQYHVRLLCVARRFLPQFTFTLM